MKKYTFVASTVGLGMLFAGVAFAQASIPAVTALKQAAINRCSVIENNVEKRLINFTNQKTKHIAQYEKARVRVVALVTKLEGEGYDVAQVKIDLVTFNDMIKKFGDDYAVYISDLTATKTYTCGRSEGEFKTELAIARAQLKVVHDDSVAVHTYWAQTIKPELDALKAPAPAITDTVEGSN